MLGISCKPQVINLRLIVVFHQAQKLPFLAAVDPVWAGEVLGGFQSGGSQAEGSMGQEPETVMAPVFRTCGLLPARGPVEKSMV
jgi:hypothetical protein